jgi:hypothetical protein
VRRLSICILTLWLAAAAHARSEDPRIDDLSATTTNGEVTVRFRLAGAFDHRRVEQIQSGIPTEITYVVEMFRDRPNWFDEGISRSRIEVRATFNSVTREYLLTYRRDRKLVRSETFSDLTTLQRHMTAIEEPSLFDVGPHRPYKLKVRVKADLMRGWLLYFVPWEISTRWKETRVAALESHP